MRLIAGKYKGRKLLLPDAKYTRPTSDRGREAIFNVLAHHEEINLVGAIVLDVFAGSGAMGLEALSRGAAHVTFIEQQPQVVQILKKNVESLGAAAHTTIIPMNFERIPQTLSPANIIFMDPPYNQGLEIEALKYIESKGWILEDTIIILETDAHFDGTPLKSISDIVEERTYGRAKFWMLQLRQHPQNKSL